jgi:hypothetical protein
LEAIFLLRPIGPSNYGGQARIAATDVAKAKSVKKERKDHKEGIATKRHKKRKKTRKIRDQIQGIAIIGPRLAFEFPSTLAGSYLALFFALFCGYSRLILAP